MLNTDVANNEVDIYNISSHKGLKVELDTRLLTEDGRNQIAEDIAISLLAGQSIADVLTKDSVSLTGATGKGETSLLQNLTNKLDLQKGTKKFVNDPKNEKARDILLNPDASPEEVQQAQQQLHIYVAKEMGIEPAELKLMLDSSNKGFTSEEDGGIHLATNLHNNMGDMANTTLNETSDVADLQRDAGIVKTDSYKAFL
ncbi:hypothetical protein [Sulfurimonas sp. CS5]|uniref:hypothetical protein n=1 Tax=Sulfurimonas sp. CS5 TaxID=3391145 RepID=UPI0039ED82A9